MQDFTKSIAYIIMVDLLNNLLSRQAVCYNPHFQTKNEKKKEKLTTKEIQDSTKKSTLTMSGGIT